MFGGLFNNRGAARRIGRRGRGSFSVIGCSNIHTLHVRRFSLTTGSLRRTLRLGTSSLRYHSCLSHTCVSLNSVRGTCTRLRGVSRTRASGVTMLLHVTSITCVVRGCATVSRMYSGTLRLSTRGMRACFFCTETYEKLNSTPHTISVLARTVNGHRSFCTTQLLHNDVLLSRTRLSRTRLSTAFLCRRVPNGRSILLLGTHMRGTRKGVRRTRRACNGIVRMGPFSVSTCHRHDRIHEDLNSDTNTTRSRTTTGRVNTRVPRSSRKVRRGVGRGVRRVSPCGIFRGRC